MLQIDTKKLIISIANKGLSATELAELSGVSRVTLARLKAGTQQARPQTLGKLAKALGVKVEDLI